MHLVSKNEQDSIDELETVLQRHDEQTDRRAANRAVGISALGLATTGLVELGIAILTGSVGLLSDAIHNLSDVSTSVVVFLGFRLSRRPPTASHPYGYDRSEDLAGLGVALVIWASAAFAGYESWHKLVHHGTTTHLGWGMVGAVIGIVGNQLVARYKHVVGRRINSSTLLADARHSWLDAISSLGALAGLIAVALGHPLGDPIAGFAITAFICHVGVEVTRDIVGHLSDAVEPSIVPTAERAAESVRGVLHAHVRARWSGRSLIGEVEGWVDPLCTVSEADAMAASVARALVEALPEFRKISWRPRPYERETGEDGALTA